MVDALPLVWYRMTLALMFVLLFLVAAAAAVFYLMKYNTAKSDLATSKQRNDSQAKQISNLQSTSQDATTLQRTITAKNAYITSLTAVANQLKTACGKTCVTIAIPTPVPTTTPTPTPTSTTTSTPAPTTSATPTP